MMALSSVHRIDAMTLQQRAPDGTSLWIPSIEYPCSLRFNTNYVHIKEPSDAWFLSYGTCASRADRDAFVAYDIPALACLCMPDVRLDKLRILSDCMAALILRDDRMDALRDDGRARLCTDALRSQKDDYACDESGWGRMFRDALGRLRAGMTPTQSARLKRHLDAFLGAVMDSIRVDGRTCSVDEYLRLRKLTVGEAIDIVFAEYSIDGLELSDALLDSPLARRVHDLNIECAIFLQDLYSCDKEIAAGERHNVVFHLAEEERCSWQEAIERACRMLGQRLDAWERLREELVSTRFPAGENYAALVGALDAFTVGFTEWTIRSPRYRIGAPPVDWMMQMGARARLEAP